MTSRVSSKLRSSKSGVAKVYNGDILVRFLSKVSKEGKSKTNFNFYDDKQNSNFILEIFGKAKHIKKLEKSLVKECGLVETEFGYAMTE